MRPGKGKKLLVVDDEALITQTLREFLEEEGYEMDAFQDSQHALKAYMASLQRQPYDLVILDIIMRGMDGLELLRQIRRKEKESGVDEMRKVPVLMVSGLRETWVEEAFEDGCTDYIVKPFHVDQLLRKVAALLNGASENHLPSERD
ncbi:MAG TPA: response regulator [Verrucomicrobiae bacterium]|nr:response regulator [Verrucomicrobiae bacterium]